jgi:hypothetical protein
MTVALIVRRIAGLPEDRNVEILQDFVSARLAGLTTFGGLNDRARQMVRTVTSAAASFEPTPRRAPFVVGHDLPRMRPGVERC